MEEKILKYKHWRTGEMRVYTLKQGEGTLMERISSLTCPFDNFPLIFIGGEDKLFCANCGEAYPPVSKQEDLHSVYAIKFEHLKFKPATDLEKTAHNS
jgi:hypothetical protein